MEIMEKRLGKKEYTKTCLIIGRAVRMVMDGKTPKEISETLHITEDTVKRIIVAHKMKGHIIAMMAEGRTTEEISEALGIPVATIEHFKKIKL